MSDITSDPTYVDPGDLQPSDDSLPLRTLHAGRGDALLSANQRRHDAALALQTVFALAPSLSACLHSTLQQDLDLDPSMCGLENAERQVTLLDVAALVMADPAHAQALAEWQTWGLADGVEQAAWTGASWSAYLSTLLEGSFATAQEHYWSSRKTGTSISAKAYSTRLLREHFLASQDIAFGLDRISADTWAQGRTQASTRYALLQWRHADGTVQACASALLIPPPADHQQWLLYRPEAKMPVRSFKDRQALLGWSHAHRKILWPDPLMVLEDESDATAIVIADLPGDGFEHLQQWALDSNQRLTLGQLQQAARHSADGVLPWADIQAWEATRLLRPQSSLSAGVQAEIDERLEQDAALATTQLHFDSLNEHLPSVWRQRRIEHQQTLLERYLGNDPSASSPKLLALRALHEQLVAVQDAQDRLLADLPAVVQTDTWGQTWDTGSRFEQISQHFSEALLAEAQLQHLLGDMSSTHLDWIKQLVQMPLPSLQRSVRPCALQLMVGARQWHLTGFVSLHSADIDADGLGDTSLLLYKPGEHGGLMAFDDAEQLTERLLQSVLGCWPEAILESLWPLDLAPLIEALDASHIVPSIGFKSIDTHVFDYCTQTLLTSLSAAATADSPVPRETARRCLCVSINRARLTAFERHAEGNRTDNLVQQLQPLAYLDLSQRTALAGHFKDLRAAMLVSSQLFERDLPERSQFALSKLKQRLREDFQPTSVPTITLNIADRVTDMRVSLAESGQANAYKLVKVFSQERSDILLEHLLLWAPDEDLTLRLGNATISFNGGSGDEALRQGVNQSYVANLFAQLDLAGAYQQQILDAFRGLPDETDWQAQWRRELLCAPFEQQLKIIAASHSRALDQAGQALLERFTQEQLDQPSRRTIDYYSLVIKPGTAIDGSSAATTLAGVFVIKAADGPVLLLLPDAPNQRVVSQYDDAAQACLALQDMALDERMREYLANLALEGEPNAHLQYINTALLKHFSGFIGLGTTRQEALPVHLANLQMGRLIMQNRATSRSQRDLYLETAAIKHGRVYDYIKMALGIIPLVGTGIALYDGWHAATASVDAFLRGDQAAGIEHLNSVFLCLTDAALDLTPLPFFGTSPARLATLARQRLRPPQPGSLSRLRYRSAFGGYQSDAPTGRWIEHPASWGAGVHRHVDSATDYIAREGRYYPVEWDATYHTWRLQGSAQRTYKLPIKRTAQGTWETHGTLSGRLIDNGLAGGGAQVSALYNRGMATLRGYLTRAPAIQSSTDVLLDIHRQRNVLKPRLSSRVAEMNRAHGVGPDGPVGEPAALAVRIKALRNAADEAFEFVDFHDKALDRLRALQAQIPAADYKRIYHELAYDLSNQQLVLMRLHSRQLTAAYQRFAHLHQQIDNLTPSTLTAHISALQRARQDFAESLLNMENDVRRHARIRSRLQGKLLTDYELGLDRLGQSTDPEGYRLLRVSSQTASIANYVRLQDPEFHLFLRRLNREVIDLRSALYSHAEIPSAVLSRAQERRLLTDLRERYQRYCAQLRALSIEFGTFVDATAVQNLERELQALITSMDASLSALTPAPKRPRATGGRSKARLFETVDEQVLIGSEINVAGQVQIQIIDPVSNVPHVQYSNAGNNRWQKIEPAIAPPAADLARLQQLAKRRLDNVPTQLADLQRYKNMNMRPRDLQDLADGYAATLRELASDIKRTSGDVSSALAQRLEQSAKELQASGVVLRIEQSMAGQQPTYSDLEYLHRQNAVTLRWSRVLEPQLDKHGKPIEYLEEYRINHGVTGEALWCAHFHFKKKPTQGFPRLEAGHIKLWNERNQRANAWRGVLTEAQANQLFGGLRPAG